MKRTCAWCGSQIRYPRTGRFCWVGCETNHRQYVAEQAGRRACGDDTWLDEMIALWGPAAASRPDAA